MGEQIFNTCGYFYSRDMHLISRIGKGGNGQRADGRTASRDFVDGIHDIMTFICLEHAADALAEWERNDIDLIAYGIAELVLFLSPCTSPYEVYLSTITLVVFSTKGSLVATLTRGV